MPILTLREFAEKLVRDNGPDARWGDEILTLLDESDDIL